MAVPAPVSDESRHTLSLEWKLPLVMTCGIAAALTVLLLSAFLVLRSRSEGFWRDRLGHAIREVARTVDRALTQRRAAMEEVARDESVRRVLASAQQAPGAALNVNEARAALARLTTAGDTAHPVELWTTRGHRILVVGPDLPVEDRYSRIISEAATSPETSETVRFSQLEQNGSHVRFWAIAPVVVNGSRVGFILQPRYVEGQRGYVQTVREFMSEDVDLYLRNVDGSLWLAAPNIAVLPPTRRDTSAAGVVNVRANSGRMLAEEAPIAGAPWVAVIEASEAAIMGPRVYSAVRLLAGLSALVVFVGAESPVRSCSSLGLRSRCREGPTARSSRVDQMRSGDSRRRSTRWRKRCSRRGASSSSEPARPTPRAKRPKRRIDRRAISWR
jgi:hypothetical protein